MCISQYVQSRHWNWEGDEIVHDPVVPSHRLVPGRERRLIKGGYLVDPREFLVTENNALLKQFLENTIGAFSGSIKRFHGRDPGDFDFRADTLAKWVGANIKHTADGQDLWLFPDETLHVGEGDCEDRAILLGALMTASGISAYNVRVALGRMVFRHDDEVVAAYDHAWVVYRREDGTWEIKEPVEVPKRRRRSTPRDLRLLLSCKIEYEPTFVLNADHLWRVRGSRPRRFDKVALRSDWQRLKPTFSGDVHRTLLHDALGGYGPSVIEELMRPFTYLFGSYVDWPDMPSRYDPRDHFDNCCIESGWERTNGHLVAFAQSRDLRRFGLAAHAIGDFYSHTSYPYFAHLRTEGSHECLRQFDPAWLTSTSPIDTRLANPARYDSGLFDLHKKGFTRGPLWGKRGVDAACQEWAGKLISGRYAHVSDSQTFFERFTWMPDEVWNGRDFWRCAAAPHHEEMAVDSSSGSNVLCGKTAYADEFKRRYATAVFHVRSEFKKVWGIPATAHPF